jgi:molybdate transport system permease protein
LASTDSSPPERRRVRRRSSARIPWVTWILAAIAVALFILPLVGLLQRAPWSDLWHELKTPAARDALRLSLECSLWSTGLSVLLGVPLAWVLARAQLPGRALLRALVLLPMVIPPVVGGVALLYAFGRSNGLVGPWLYDTFGAQFTFSKSGVILAETFVAMPFLVLTVEGGLRAIDSRYEEASATLGAGRWTTFRRVTLRFLAPSLAAGIALAWARALGEFGATITFAGNIAGRTQTTPLAVYLLLDTQPGAAIALSLVLLAVSIVVLVSLRDRWFAVIR